MIWYMLLEDIYKGFNILIDLVSILWDAMRLCPRSCIFCRQLAQCAGMTPTAWRKLPCQKMKSAGQSCTASQSGKAFSTIGWASHRSVPTRCVLMIHCWHILAHAWLSYETYEKFWLMLWAWLLILFKAFPRLRFTATQLRSGIPAKPDSEPAYVWNVLEFSSGLEIARKQTEADFKRTKKIKVELGHSEGGKLCGGSPPMYLCPRGWVWHGMTTRAGILVYSVQCTTLAEVEVWSCLWLCASASSMSSTRCVDDLPTAAGLIQEQYV